MTACIAHKKDKTPQMVETILWIPFFPKHHQTSNISHTPTGNKLVDHLDAAPGGAAPTTSPFSIEQMAPMNSAKTTARRDAKQILVFGASYIRCLTVNIC